MSNNQTRIKENLRVGDRVVYRRSESGIGNADLDGKHGEIVYIDRSRVPYTVLFEGDFVADYYNDLFDRRIDLKGRKGKIWFCQGINLTKEEEYEANLEKN